MMHFKDIEILEEPNLKAVHEDSQKRSKRESLMYPCKYKYLHQRSNDLIIFNNEPK